MPLRKVTKRCRALPCPDLPAESHPLRFVMSRRLAVFERKPLSYPSQPMSGSTDAASSILVPGDCVTLAVIDDESLLEPVALVEAL
jgi:hypothetical protein